MTVPSLGRFRPVLLLVGLLSLGGSGTPLLAQKAPPPPKPNPGAAVLSGLNPLGARPGATIDLNLTGTNLAGPVELWTSFPARATFPPDGNNGKDQGKLRVRLEVDPAAPPGIHALRLATKRGMSNVRLFSIDELPTVQGTNKNSSPGDAQVVPVPCVVDGVVEAEHARYYNVHAAQGQRLTFEILGRRLGSALDPQLKLFEEETGKELPGGYSNDSPALQTDCRLTYVSPKEGDYIVEVRDVTHRGGADYFYRLRVGDFPCATSPIPLAVRRGKKATIGFAGTSLEGVAPVEINSPADPGVTYLWLTPRRSGGPAGTSVGLLLTDQDELQEQEPNNDPPRANPLPIPAALTARFEAKGDVDCFTIATKKGQRFVVEAQSLELHTPTEVYMVLRDAAGKQLAASNPEGEPRLDYTPPSDGNVTLAVEHLHYWGGPEEAYRLVVEPYQPSFDLSIGLDRFDVRAGDSISLPVQVARKDYKGPIQLKVVGDSGLLGEGTIPADKPAGEVSLTANSDLQPGARIVRVVGKATINGKPVESTASVRAAVSQSLNNLPFPPWFLFDQIAVTVTEKPPFSLAASLEPSEVLRGGTAVVKIRATRAPGFDEPITLGVEGLPANVKAEPTNIAKGQTEGSVRITPAVAAALGKLSIKPTGTAKVEGQSVVVRVPPLVAGVVPPFDLKLQPTSLSLKAGAKVKIKVTASRHASYQGPIVLELRGAQPGVTAPKVTLAPDQKDGELEIAAAGTAKDEKKDVTIVGTAPAAGNQTHASAPFAIRIEKP